ncbi:MAG: helix-turn-helix transcriptional regulator [Candidatus Handelsmanbacteria bacterium]|nr:helix-turn-helix transcriptional regulator [Candidatus Handelsmanbacteria bacterium]
MEKDLEVFGACADQTRLRVLLLLTQGELCVCELVEVLEMPQGKISRHLGVLKRAGLVHDRREGVWIYYALSKPDTSLKQQLYKYLNSQAAALAAEDLQRLQKLAKAGQICCPRPVNGVARQAACR